MARFGRLTAARPGAYNPYGREPSSAGSRRRKGVSRCEISGRPAGADPADLGRDAGRRIPGRGRRRQGGAGGEHRRIRHEDHRAEHRPGQPKIPADLPGHRHHPLLRRVPRRLRPDRVRERRARRPWPRRPRRATCARTPSTRVTGKNTGNNLGPGSPVFHLHQHRGRRGCDVRLILKGGGCENVGAQYSLPDATPIGADRDLDGVPAGRPRRRLAGAGQGLRPGLPRRLHRRRPRHRLRARQGAAPPHARRRQPRPGAGRSWSSDIRARAPTQLGIGPMGFGGKTDAARRARSAR